MLPIFLETSDKAVTVHTVAAKDLEKFLSARAVAEAQWLRSTGFAAKEGELVLVPKTDGGLASAVLGLGGAHDPLALALFSERLPAGDYTFGDVNAAVGGELGALAWALGTYGFDRYKPRKKNHPRLVLPKTVDGERVSYIAEGMFLGRDLVNTPSNDMGPAELEKAARDMAAKHGAKISVITGDELLKQNYPMIHAVGRASPREPRLIDMRWGDAGPKITLVGKGVCFDTGGLDLKPSSAMLTMKKDMGGAACVLGLAHMILSAKLNVRLRVMIPAVENSVSGSAYRPGDVLTSRKGLTVEIGNTDAEGRLVLADALAEADTETPDIMVCMATLTGAARSATGMELPPFFTDDEKLAADLSAAGMREHDPMWRLPLWRSYESAVESAIADLTNNPDYNLAGAITAALFLNRFVVKTSGFVHLDIPAWVDRPKPGRRKGAEANTIRALFSVISERARA